MGLLKIIITFSFLYNIAITEPDITSPEDICKSMMLEPEVKPQTNEPPYWLFVDKLPDDQLLLLIRPKAERITFTNFMFQVRDTEDQPFGEFVQDDDLTLTLLDCPPGEKNAVTYKNDTPRDFHKARWIAPVNYTGEIRPISSIGRENHEYWINITFNTLYMEPEGVEEEETPSPVESKKKKKAKTETKPSKPKKKP